MKKTALAILFILTLSVIAIAQQDKGKRPAPLYRRSASFQMERRSQWITPVPE